MLSDRVFVVALRAMLESLREFTELRELTPAIVNTLIRRNTSSALAHNQYHA